MPGRVPHPTRALDEIRHARGRPQRRLVSQRVGASLQPLANPGAVRRGQPRLAARPARPLERRAAGCLQLPRPAIHRLPVDAQLARDLGFTDPLSEQRRGPEAPSFQRLEISRDTCRIAHAPHDTTRQRKCHYIIRDSIGVGEPVITTSGRKVRITRTTSESTCWRPQILSVSSTLFE